MVCEIWMWQTIDLNEVQISRNIYTYHANGHGPCVYYTFIRKYISDLIHKMLVLWAFLFCAKF